MRVLKEVGRKGGVGGVGMGCHEGWREMMRETEENGVVI